jgi:formate dehydrogenase
MSAAHKHPKTVAAVPLELVRQSARRAGRLKGRQADEQSVREVRDLIGQPAEGALRRDLLIEYLHALNDRYQALHERHLVALARDMRLSMAEVYEVASFYHHFEILPEGEQAARLTVRVCEGLSCEIAGARDLLSRLPGLLPSDVRLVAAPCIGRCEQAPAAQVGQRALPCASVPALVQACSADQPSLPSLTAHIGYDAYRAAGGYELVRRLALGQEDPQGVMQTLEDAGLRGLGGAGFPAGRKWRIVRAQPSPRLMAVNIDEGEPGTFKDRTYLEHDPHRFLEGMLVAAQVVGLEACYIYLRDEYHEARHMLAGEIARLKADPPCPLPHIELRRGAGAYICGEESAMIESIEGKRGEPRLRPPYIAEVGLFGRPTLAHNLETLHWVREIVERGAAWFTAFGANGRKGLRSFSVSGRVRQPGVKLAPAGITLRELVDQYCGGMAEEHALYAYLPGGASGGILPASMADIPLDFDTLQPYGCFIGSAAIVVLSQHDRARDAALNTMRFFAHESCGQCTPCRVGTTKAASLMAAPSWDVDTLQDLAQVMADASICGLGQAAPNPLRSVMAHFAHELGGAA